MKQARHIAILLLLITLPLVLCQQPIRNQEDVYVEYEYDPLGYVEDSVGGFIFGILGFVLSLIVVWVFEMQSAKRAGVLEDVVRSVRSIESGVPGEKSLVHLTGLLNTFDYVTDEVFGVTLNVLKMKRVVEVFQWKEERYTERNGDVKRTEYRYKSVWKEGVEDSNSFRYSTDHMNPTHINIHSKEYSPRHGLMDNLFVSDEILEKIYTHPVQIHPGMLNGYHEILSHIIHIPQENCFYTGYDYHNPMVGDLRIRFEIAENELYSIIGERNNEQLVPFIQNGEKIALIQRGYHSANAMVNLEKEANKSCLYMTRVVCLIINIVCSILIMSPILNLVSFVPIFGPIVASSGILLVILLSFVWIGLTIALSAIFRNQMLFIIIAFALLLFLVNF